MKARPLIVALRLEGRDCLVIGSGAEAERRVASLVRAGARVRWIPTDGATPKAAPPAVTITSAAPTESDLDAVWLALVTDRDPELAARLFAAAQARRVLFCAVDQPAYCNFAHCALAESGPVSVAISTGGGAPALAARLRTEFERVFQAARLGEFAEALSALRARLPRDRRAADLGRVVRGVRLHGTLELPEIDSER